MPASTPALLGGTPVRTKPWPTWPIAAPETGSMFENIIRSRKWTRHSGRYVVDFENALAKRIGVKYALTVWTGTDALACMMRGVDIAPGDEVLVTPYTFYTGAAAPLYNHALPVFVNVDRESFQMDPAKIEEKITPDTRAILVCHWGGQAADMDRILAVARKHQLAVCEDSYQALFGEWRGQQLGSLGDVGMIGHHQGELLPAGEGATLIGNDEAVMDRCYSAHDFGREVDWDTHRPTRDYQFHRFGHNMKVTELQGAVLLAALQHVEEWSQRRAENADYLAGLLRQIPGIVLQKEYAGQTRRGNAALLFRYDNREFHGLPIARFAAAMRAEGVPLFRGIGRPLSEEPHFREVLESARMQQFFSPSRLERARASLECPAAAELCKEAAGIQGPMLHATRADMEGIAEAIRKVQAASASLKS